jgi:hypothetical protein
MKAKLAVLTVMRYNFDDDQGRNIKGGKASAADCDTFLDDQDKRGLAVAEWPMDRDTFDAISEHVPCIVEVDVETRTTKKKNGEKIPISFIRGFSNPKPIKELAPRAA